MVHHSLLFCLFLLFAGHSFGQDERYYRQILTGELPGTEIEHKESSIKQLDVEGASYRIDLNGDGIEESLVPQKKDGVDAFTIRDSSERVIFQTKMLAMGGMSHIYKIKIVQLSTKLKALLIFLDEGKTAGRKFESTARFYVLSFENNDLTNIKVAEGPHIFHEKEAQRDQYYRRDYQVNVYDINNDGVREISVEFNHIQRIMMYQDGIWIRI